MIRSQSTTHAAGRPSRLPSLTTQIFIGLLLGIAVGYVWPSFGVAIKPLADVFLRMIKMIIAPLLFSTLVVGIAGTGDLKAMGRIGLKAIVYFEIVTTIALFLGLGAVNLVRPGEGVPITQTAAEAAIPATQTTLSTVLEHVFPASIIDAMARNDVLQIVVFSVFLGLAVSAAGARAKLIKDLADAGAEAVFKLVGFVMWFAPLGVGAAIAVTLGASGTAVLLPLVKCIAALYGALIVFFVLLFAAMKLLTRAHMATFLAAIREPAIIAFTTASSDAALPRAMQVLEQLGVPRRIVSFVVPTGYAFNLDGSTLYLSLAVVFVAQAAHVDMSWGQQLAAMVFLMLSSKGVAGVPRAALVVLAGALTAFNLPAEGVALLLGIDAVMDMGRTCVNVVGNCVATVVVAVWEKAIPADAPIFRPRAAPGSDLPQARVVRDADSQVPVVEPTAGD
jgi:proton glutamate symport protein